MWSILGVGLLVVVLLISKALYVYEKKTGVPDQPVHSKYIDIMDLYELSDGRICFRLVSNDGYVLSTLEEHRAYDEKDYRLCYYRPEVKEKINRSGKYKSTIGNFNEYYHIVTMEEGIERIIYTTSSNDIKVIWKKGMVIEKAPLEVEKACKEQEE